MSDLSVSIPLSPIYPTNVALFDPRTCAAQDQRPASWRKRTWSLPPWRRRISRRTRKGPRSAPINKRLRLREAVERTNRTNARRNARIEVVLCQTTGQDLGESPTKWWNWWWQDYNESYDLGGGTDQSGESPAKPVEHYDYNLQYPGGLPHSCFAPGTKVWTLTGRRPIEKIQVGDCVLAQDVDSGELAYKPVLAVTVRKPVPRMKVGVGSETIVATPSHPFWVVGQGWRMTKQLSVGDRFHTTSGAVAVGSIEKVEADQSGAGWSYNLIVADFDSYFVGERGILVHDTTPRALTAALAPGLAQQVSRDSAR